jgi:hypothetical protein
MLREVRFRANPNLGRNLPNRTLNIKCYYRVDQVTLCLIHSQLSLYNYNYSWYGG